MVEVVVRRDRGDRLVEEIARRFRQAHDAEAGVDEHRPVATAHEPHVAAQERVRVPFPEVPRAVVDLPAREPGILAHAHGAAPLTSRDATRCRARSAHLLGDARRLPRPRAGDRVGALVRELEVLMDAAGAPVVGTARQGPQSSAVASLGPRRDLEAHERDAPSPARREHRGRVQRVVVRGTARGGRAPGARAGPQCRAAGSCRHPGWPGSRAPVARRAAAG